MSIIVSSGKNSKGDDDSGNNNDNDNDNDQNDNNEDDDNDDNDARSTTRSVAGTNDLNDNDTTTGEESSVGSFKRLVKAEVTPPKSLLLIWILMVIELGFDLITTAIAFFSSLGKTDCCGHGVKLGPLPMTATIPFFLLIVTELTFLGRAILLTLWPSIFESQRLEFHHHDDNDNDDDNDDQSIGFEVEFATKIDNDNDTADNNDNDNNINTSNHKSKSDSDSNAPSSSSKKINGNINNDADDEKLKEMYMDEIPEFIDYDSKKNKQQQQSWLKRCCCCFLRWNAKMVLAVLNLMTLINPFFGCIIAWILLYQSDKTEAFTVLGIEALAISLHFVSVWMEGGLRTWYSKVFHSISLVPFFVIVILMLVYLREGGVCYSVEKEIFLFTGCEVCPETFEPPNNEGMCTITYGNDDDIVTNSNNTNSTTATTITYSLEGINGGFVQEFQNLGNSINSIKDMKNFANLIDRGADQDTYCSDDINFCFYEF